jgi:hypothetical protein
MNSSSSSDPKRELLRHSLATLAYRGGKIIRGASDGFGDFAGAGKTPRQILTHIGDLLEWALTLANGTRKWQNTEPLPWTREGERFFATLKAFDDYLASSEPLQAPSEKLFQGPVADALTHVGQLAMLRRMAGEPIAAENYFIAEVIVGRVGEEQALPKRKG